MDEAGIKLVKLEDIFTGDGVQPRNLHPMSLIMAIHLPLKQGFRAVFQKLRQRESMDFTSLTAVVAIDANEKIMIVLGGVDPRPVVVEGDKHADKEELIKLAIKKSRAIDNEMFSRTYRREMIGVFLRRAFTQLAI
jgi:CO/xanthine dehydrogenase FAD-binding subunit